MSNTEGSRIEGRNPVIEAFRSGKTVEKLYVLDGCRDGAVMTILREAKKQGTIVRYVSRERLNAMAETAAHQGVIAQVSDFKTVELSEILEKAREAGEPPFVLLLDGVEDPYNFGAILRTACQAGVHGVVTTKQRSAPMSAAAAKASAGAIHYIPVARVANLAAAIEELKKEGLWFVCADMDGTQMYDLDLTGPVGVVVGSEGSGVSRLVKEKCDLIASIPMTGKIDSLNVSVACAVLTYEIVRQRMGRK